ncbi:MAG TPA: hypothetical protein VFV89_17600 [Nocardioides sp.]|uniref:hypothetical protein n=1 Tax=Nocardioides sp. TaxID=35761 RepID=UPI002E379AB3|nr:hypothetical protein [Nocardioides sp.]HEX5089627.1 hypothetical protein [Nocardioides sp.]
MDDYLRGRLEDALGELARIEPDVLLAENADVTVAGLLQKHMPDEIKVDWAGATRTPVTEVTTQFRDQFDREEIYTVPASKVVVSFPVSGTTEMLDYQASTFSMGGKYGKISGGSVVVEIVERALDADTVRQRVDQVRQDIDKRVAWANGDLISFRASAEQSIRASLSSRRERILNDRQVEEALGIPVRSSAVPRPPVPARRKQVTLQSRTAQADFVPEPVLDEAVYQDVLDAVRAWATSLERTPGTAAKLDEEELRDLLLGNLNTYWQGGAGGELFNGSGKTDILIRHGDRNAFIAECKIWRGPKGVAEALDQLLGYLVWRDSKSALIVFIKTADPAATLEKLHSAVEAHPRYILTKDTSTPSSRVDYIVTADDEGRRVSLAVIPVIIRPAGS